METARRDYNCFQNGSTRTIHDDSDFGGGIIQYMPYKWHKDKRSIAAETSAQR